MPAASLRRSEDLDQYEWVVGDAVVSVLGYEERDSTIVLLHTATDPGHRRQGHATALVAAVLEDVRARGLTPSVRCPFIRAYLHSHPAQQPGA